MSYCPSPILWQDGIHTHTHTHTHTLKHRAYIAHALITQSFLGKIWTVYPLLISSHLACDSNTLFTNQAISLSLPFSLSLSLSLSFTIVMRRRSTDNSGSDMSDQSDGSFHLSVAFSVRICWLLLFVLFRVLFLSNRHAY